jgi:hypothetical protein
MATHGRGHRGRAPHELNPMNLASVIRRRLRALFRRSIVEREDE